MQSAKKKNRGNLYTRNPNINASHSQTHHIHRNEVFAGLVINTMTSQSHVMQFTSKNGKKKKKKAERELSYSPLPKLPPLSLLVRTSTNTNQPFDPVISLCILELDLINLLAAGFVGDAVT